MFYNRQREVALRKCMGSEIKGLFLLLFTEVFWMMSTAFLLSLVLTELMINLAEIYIPSHDMPDLPLSSIYVVQFHIYIALLMICMLVIWFPIRRLRQVSIISQINNNRSRHIFRSIMMWLQLGIAIFFVGSTLGVNMVWHETFSRAYSPLTSEEEENIISLKVNTQRMWQNLNPILSDIRALPECIETLTMTDDLRSGSHFMRTYKKADQSEVWIAIAEGSPSYFKFLNIPLQGKEVSEEAEGTVYVSEDFRLQLDKDSVQDRVEIEGSEVTESSVPSKRSIKKSGEEIPLARHSFPVIASDVSISNWHRMRTLPRVSTVLLIFVGSTYPLLCLLKSVPWPIINTP